ncbi:MAG: ABC transporter ATP-binding protein [Candidatus Bipolaricaulota bacterium]|nr:ABC transporter ATP-binding protein [Candidatus Bipolaricaulota bacterium]MDW8110616.1 ABC transporter ATP-binding protein [Candidatus Bipolaricaulota bacterium]MDW8329851.1 ABC transporter ATP-binding protein [Candidatus Bipolaricaulota bacterium]
MLQLEEIEVRYGPIIALRDLSLKISEGQIVTVLGANGAGKTTLLRTISGLLRPTKGRIRFDSRELQRASPEEIVRLGIVQVPEGRQLFPDLTVRENLWMGSYSRRDGEIKRDWERVLEYFPVLRERLSQPAGTLSGGEQQMLAIGRALMARPKLLLLDEPSLGLAPVVVQQLFRFLKELNRSEKMTILLAEQNAHMSLGIAHEGYVLETGTVQLFGSASELQRNPHVQRLYLGGRAGGDGASGS